MIVEIQILVYFEMSINLLYIGNDLAQKGNDPYAKLNVIIDYDIGIIDYAPKCSNPNSQKGKPKTVSVLINYGCFQLIMKLFSLH